VSYTQSLMVSISVASLAGYRSTTAFSGVMRPLNAVLNIRMISELSLLTIVSSFLSHSTGTVKLTRVDSIVKENYGHVGLLLGCLPSRVVRVSFEVEILDVLEFVQRINLCAREVVHICERPAFGAHERAHNDDGYFKLIICALFMFFMGGRHTNDILEAFELPDDESPRRPS
jgi:hypothetical protein